MLLLLLIAPGGADCVYRCLSCGRRRDMGSSLNFLGLIADEEDDAEADAEEVALGGAENGSG
jgi:hypothetical protein